MNNERYSGAATRLAYYSAQLLGWRPSEFWDSTPAELLGALAPPSEAGSAPDRALIAALRARFPDDRKQD